MKKFFKKFVDFIKENWFYLLGYWLIFFLQSMGYLLIAIICK